MGTSTEETDRLESWKQIAAYLNKSERTVRRWHEVEGLPVHKHQHRQRGSVWAYRNELDQWLDGRVVRPEPEPESERVANQPRPKPPLWALAFAGLALALGAVQISRFGTRAEPLIRGVPLTAMPGSEYGASFSPDGKRVVFHWSPLDGTAKGLYTKEIGSDAAPKPVIVSSPQTPAFIYSPAWSPDGSTIGFLERTAAQDTWLSIATPDGRSYRKVKQISAAPVLFFGNHQHVSWTLDSQSLVVPMALHEDRGIYRVSKDTGEVFAIAKATSAYAPAVSPNGRLLLWLRREGLPIAFEELLLTRLKSDGSADGDPVLLYKGHSVSSGVAWAVDSRSLLFCNTGSSIAGSFPGRLYRLQAAAATALVEVGGAGCNTVTVSPTGEVAYGASRSALARILGVALHRPDVLKEFVVSSRYDSNPSFSPDGRRIAFYSTRSGQPDIWVVDRDGSQVRRVTTNSMLHSGPTWSPVTDEIAFASGHSLVISDLNGATKVRIDVPQGVVQNPAWSGDGQTIYFTAGPHLWRTRRNGSDRRIIRELPEIFSLAASPDGKHLYYSKPGNGFLVGRVPIEGGSEEVVEDGLDLPFFAMSRHALYLARKNGGLYALPLTGGEARRVENVATIQTAGHRSWEARFAVAPDDSMLLLVRPEPQEIDLEIWKPPSP